MLFMEDASTPLNKWSKDFEALYEESVKKNIPAYIVTSAMNRVKSAIAHTAFQQIEILNGDNTMIRMAARTNPTIYVLRNGTIKDKQSYKRFDKVHF